MINLNKCNFIYLFLKLYFIIMQYKPSNSDVVYNFEELNDEYKNLIFEMLKTDYDSNNNYVNILQYCLHDNITIYNKYKNIIDVAMIRNKQKLIIAFKKNDINNLFSDENLFNGIKCWYHKKYQKFGIIDRDILDIINNNITIDISLDYYYELITSSIIYS